MRILSVGSAIYAFACAIFTVDAFDFVFFAIMDSGFLN